MLVFVYGTLTDPERVASLLEDGPGEYEFVGPATLEGLHRVDGRYPTLVPGGSADGRLLSVDEPALERLDRYEGVDRGLYVRVAVSGPDDRRVWIYVGQPDRLGVDTADGWPDDRPFRDAVRSAVVPDTTVVRRRE
ncbi:gamma-glutamylcyclotransferase [Haloterrigena sp. SYSU A558-1]|uniref:Gamma-glutamylcyclotransferase n=1 Tax=Haloterrigena gelatinilytica TaxID=2741724 RepID=A0ABX2LAC9_9EURY|nr:gamma-glutamylcyclotransferase family protein [Haloterrigena gelatinilytica]NUC70791.1 gamma-glutamylcyclotransferase [Haloterrigena gelatinilytica]